MGCCSLIFFKLNSLIFSNAASGVVASLITAAASSSEIPFISANRLIIYSISRRLLHFYYIQNFVF